MHACVCVDGQGAEGARSKASWPPAGWERVGWLAAAVRSEVCNVRGWDVAADQRFTCSACTLFHIEYALAAVDLTTNIAKERGVAGERKEREFERSATCTQRLR